MIASFAEEEEGVTLSMGIAQTGPKEFDDVDSLIRRADEMMYKAKQEPGFQIMK